MEKFTVGALLGGYEAQRFKNKPTPLALKSVDILRAGSGDAAAAISRGQGAAKGVLLSRLGDQFFSPEFHIHSFNRFRGTGVGLGYCIEWC